MAVILEDKVTFGGGIIHAGSIGILSPPSIIANQNDYNPTGLSDAHTLRLDATANRNITGVLAQEGGRTITLINISAFAITLVKASALSLASNRFQIDGNIVMNANASVIIWYDITTARWRII